MIAALVDHLWQSTFFAGGAFLTTLLLRKNGAHLRHGVWLIASIKFLIPFSLLAMLGGQLKPFLDTESANALAMLATADVSVLMASPGRVVSAASPGNFWLGVAAGVWILGFLALTARWFIRWRRVRLLLSAAAATEIVASVPVMTAPGLREPGVAGIFRPVLLLPERIEGHLSAAQLQAILEHELCHVRRHDNLAASIHMLVEALFWFHPLVWWIGARMIHERERACDEEVVRSGNDPHVYSEGILKVCRSYVASDLACVSGVSGADLKTRLEGIMKTRNVAELTVIKRFALGAVTVSAFAAPVILGLASPAQAEAPAAQHAINQVGKIALLPGKRVKLDYENVDVRALIRAMAEAAGVNILVSNKVSGNVTVKLAEISWEQALDIILSSQGLVSREKDGILFIDPAPIVGSWQLSNLKLADPDDKC